MLCYILMCFVILRLIQLHFGTVETLAAWKNIIFMFSVYITFYKFSWGQAVAQLVDTLH
jgi:hypothetical protein